jgi:uncharacterized phage protein gp47/JayE
VAATVRANTAGTVGNVGAGEKLTFANTPPGVAGEAVVTGVQLAAKDGEPQEAYRRRVIAKVQKKPRGGALADYQLWALEVPGILDAFPYTGATANPPRPGEIDVYVEADTADGIPTAAQMAEVFASIQGIDPVSGKATRRPVGAAVNVKPIERQEFLVTVTGLWPDSTRTQDAINEAVLEFLRTRRPFIEGLLDLPRSDMVTAGNLGGVIQDIVDACSASMSHVTVTPTPPEGRSSLNRGQLAYLSGGRCNFT